MGIFCWSDWKKATRMADYQDDGYDEGYYDENYDEGYDEPAQSATLPDGRPAPPPRHGGASQQEQGYVFTALYDFTGSNPEELSFRVGDEILVLSQAKEGWYSASLNGQTGYVPSNYVQIKENTNDLAAAKKARRQKMMAERNDLRAIVEEKRAKRKQLEEEVKQMEDSLRERKALIKKLANPTENPEFVLNDLTTLALELYLEEKQQARYAELSTSLMLGLSSLQGQLNMEVKAGNALQEQKKIFDEQIAQTKQAYTQAGEALNQLIRARKDFTAYAQDLRKDLSASLK